MQVRKQIFHAAMYLRLSREDRDKDGRVKSESDSIGNQRELIKAFIDGQSDIEFYDIYVDDGFSGSNFDRPEFKRMEADIESGRVNCVIVKDLSRFGRDYIETGRYIQKIFPAMGVRFIALTDNYDSIMADTGENCIVLPIKNFINDSYCRDISTKVKSGLEVKRRNGDCISPFAVYGYLKDEKNKNHLIIDECAACNVRKIYEWKIEGLAVSAIADRLNFMGILSPKEYKKYMGQNFNGGFAGVGKSMWSSAAVKRILTNEIYLGHMIQGKTRKINYKVKKIVEKPRGEWVRVENTHDAVIPEDYFRIVQNLLRSDGRVSTETKGTGFFAGLLFCGDCREQMIRRKNNYKGKSKIYYICSTKNRGDGCTRHAIEENVLKEIVISVIKIYANMLLEAGRLSNTEVQKKNSFNAVSIYDREIIRLKEEEDKYIKLCQCLYKDIRAEVITKEEFERLYFIFNNRAEMAKETQKNQAEFIRALSQKRVNYAGHLKELHDSLELKVIDRHALCSFVRRIYVYENRRIEIEFFFEDRLKSIADINSDLLENEGNV